MENNQDNNPDHQHNGGNNNTDQPPANEQHNSGNTFLEDVTGQRNPHVPNTDNPQNNQHQQPQQNNRPTSSPQSSPSRSSSSEQDDKKWQYQSIKEAEQHIDIPKEVPQLGGSIGLREGNKNREAIRYKYCCKKCKHADRDKDKKACVCVVPRDQRRTHLGNQGCQTCGCDGCSKEDFIFRGQDPEYHPEDKKKETNKKEEERFQARNGCCKNCMKAFSKTGKSCICQVPEDVRKTKLCSSGCKICGCVGCNPEDKKTHQKSQRHVRRSRSRSERRKEKRQRRSHSKQKKRRSKSRSPQIIDTYAMNFHNIDRSIIGSMIINEYQIDPALLGFGIPQRSSSYLSGKTKQK